MDHTTLAPAPRSVGPACDVPPTPTSGAIGLAPGILWSRAAPGSDLLFFVTARSEVWSVAATVASALDRFLGSGSPRANVPIGNPVLAACVHAGILVCDVQLPETLHRDVCLVSAAPPWNTHCPNDGPFGDGGCGTTAYSGNPF